MTTESRAAATALMTVLALTGCASGEAMSSPRPATSGPVEAGEAPRATQPAGPEVSPEVPGPRARGTEDWRLTRNATDGQIAAYATAVSGVPGTRLGVKVSTPEARFRVAVYRLGAYDVGSGTLVTQTGWQPGRVQAAAVLRPAETRTVVAPWEVDVDLDTTDWEPGFHVLTLTTGRGWQTQVPYIVSSPSAAGTVALVAPVTTWQAYNQWGGYSLYFGPEGDRRSWAVSFDRPWSWSMGQANDFRTSTVPAVLLAERLGIRLSYFSNVDLHVRPDALAGAHGYVSTGHDEYWTQGMRDAVTRARDAGTNLAVLGANTMYWQIRLEDTATGPARRLVGYRHDAALDPLTDRGSSQATTRWRDGPLPRPEHELLGMQYECYPVDTDYVVATPGWWGFAGTGVQAGDRIPGLVGPEADRVYPDARLPRPLQILSASPYNCGGAPTQSHSIYYTASSGAAVFNAGTLRWVCAIVDRCERRLGPRPVAFTRQVTANLLRTYAAGPVGAQRPARDNVDDFGLSTVNTVPAS